MAAGIPVAYTEKNTGTFHFEPDFMICRWNHMPQLVQNSHTDRDSIHTVRLTGQPVRVQADLIRLTCGNRFFDSCLLAAVPAGDLQFSRLIMNHP
ncbi:hypothetical protein D3C73_1496130 [compost metagenome]